jgi:hypothetical protein
MTFNENEDAQEEDIGFAATLPNLDSISSFIFQIHLMSLARLPFTIRAQSGFWSIGFSSIN